MILYLILCGSDYTELILSIPDDLPIPFEQHYTMESNVTVFEECYNRRLYESQVLIFVMNGVNFAVILWLFLIEGNFLNDLISAPKLGDSRDIFVLCHWVKQNSEVVSAANNHLR